jgi:hypothetical protein
MAAVTEGNRPLRPSDDRCHSRGLNDEIWNVIETCWAQEPNDRLSARQIVERLRPSFASRDERPYDTFDPKFSFQMLYSQTDHPFSALAGLVDDGK